MTENNLCSLLEKFSREVNEKLHPEPEILFFCKTFLDGVVVHQSRFLSTSMTIDTAKEYGTVVLWNWIMIPKNIQGAFIESFLRGEK